TGGASAGAYAELNLAAHVGDDPARVAENRRRLVSGLGLPAEPRWLEQVHGARVLDLDRAPAPATGAPPGEGAGAGGEAPPSGPADATGADREASPPGPADATGAGPEAPRLGPADGAVTGRPGTVCAVLTADCLPVLLADSHGRRVGVAHAGWRGLAAGVLPAAVAALGVPPRDVVAWLGPAIGPSAYEVGDDVRRAFAAAGFATAAAFAPNARGRWQADLCALARESLAAAGVERVFGGGYCTYAEADRFFSHRREGPCGRFATLIWIATSGPARG
ncbi:MAG TPA: peptidoglycan editing factor PgeF, partial [Gammaproteobacteria bacterium]|nr:peptidoglycan editing factor PgeF [Gammaproteobacteria bacterium]